MEGATIDRRQFLKCAGLVAAGLFFFPKEVLAETVAKKKKFAKSTLAEAEKYLVSQGLKKSYARGVLLDGRTGRIARDGVLLSARQLRRMGYAKYKEAFGFEQLKKWGEQFMIERKGELAASQEKTGVPCELTAALLGVESQYGRAPMKYPAANVFLAALEDSAKISDADRQKEKKDGALRELAGLLKLCSKYPADPLEVKGSYAGAITPAQFMPSNLWKYDREGLIASASFEDFFSMTSAITLASTYLQRNGIMDYNPKDTRKYGRLIGELAEELKKARGNVQGNVAAGEGGG